MNISLSLTALWTDYSVNQIVVETAPVFRDLIGVRYGITFGYQYGLFIESEKSSRIIQIYLIWLVTRVWQIPVQSNGRS